MQKYVIFACGKMKRKVFGKRSTECICTETVNHCKSVFRMFDVGSFVYKATAFTIFSVLIQLCRHGRPTSDKNSHRTKEDPH